MSTPVTERDFRAPEFRDAKVEDYERRADGAIVHKDRWENAIHSIAMAAGIDTRKFEVGDVVDECQMLLSESFLTTAAYIAIGAAKHTCARTGQLENVQSVLCEAAPLHKALFYGPIKFYGAGVLAYDIIEPVGFKLAEHLDLDICFKLEELVEEEFVLCEYPPDYVASVLTLLRTPG